MSDVFLRMNFFQVFIFDDESYRGSTLLSYDLRNEKCTMNGTVVQMIKIFKVKFDKLTRLTRKELRKIDKIGFEESKKNIFESKGNIVAKLSDSVRLILNYCVENEKERKKVETNSLLLMRSYLNFICKMDERLFEEIYVDKVERCFIQHKQNLTNCAMNSYDLYFWSKSPNQSPAVVDLVHGAVC